MLVGIVPMGGLGERWAPYPCPKELLPFGADREGRPLVIGDYVVQRMETAGVELIVIPVRAEKATAVLSYFGHRRPAGAAIVYVAAPGPSLVANLQACLPLLGSHTVLFGMPDTYFTPGSAFVSCLAQLDDPTEVVLGCWTYPNPVDLDTVDRIGDYVRAVYPKPRDGADGLNEAWGIAAWSPAFTERMRGWSDPRRHNPGFIFQAAAADGRARAVGFLDGTYADLGSYGLYQQALRDLVNGDPNDFSRTCNGGG